MLVNDDYETILDPSTNKAVRVLKDTTIRVIDFSYITFIEHRQRGERHTCMRVCPEMDLGIKWSYMADVWNIGNMLTKLYRGVWAETFQDVLRLCAKTQCQCLNVRRLACLERVIGPYPQALINKRGYFFYSNGSVNIRYCTTKEKLDEKCKPLKSMMRSNEIENRNFFDLLEQMLRHDPDQRITLPRALKHPFFDALSEEQRTLQ
uniref:Protein kinase domain-containing protein n=1 Tax=Plectus sambesii TaxID=2011161 RepID=A0A914XQ96_9BILA